MITAQEARSTSQAVRDGGTWTPAQRKRIRNKVKREIASIFESEWAPKIQAAAARGKRKVEIVLGPSGSPEATARSDYGKIFLKEKGYRVQAPELYGGKGGPTLTLEIEW